MGEEPRARKAKSGDANAVDVAEDDWPWWRGPNRNGIAAAGQTPPLEWSANKHLVWKAMIPGRGHGSPTVQGDRVFLATADETAETQTVVCYDRRTGEVVWQTVVHRGGLKAKNKKASLASSSVACDGQRVFVNFFNSGAIYTTALDRAGKQIWQTKISDYVVHQGYGSSPAIYRSLVIVSADNKGGGAIAGLARDSGEIVWKRDRPAKPNYASPIILRAAGKEQLIFTGCDLVSSFNPLTGATLWETKGATTECVTSAVTDGTRVFTSGGYPDNHVSAVLADGSGKLAWENSVRVYVPSMIVHNGYLFAVTDAGVARCWKSDSGEQVWQGRLGGTFSGSPVLAGGHLFATNERGRTFVFKADPERFELVAQNQLGAEAFATPVICGSRIYLRAATKKGGRRQEVLYCIGLE